MVVVSPAPALLDAGVLSLYYTKDPLLANLPVLVFYGPSTTTNSTLNSSRIQAHVYSLAGFQSFPRLTISPASPLYAAVNHLPADKKGDETCRGLAVSLLKYFAEMPKAVKSSLTELTALARPDGLAPAMFDEMHAGDLAAAMVKVDNTDDIASYIRCALSEKSVSWTDVDVVLPAKSTKKLELSDDPDDMFLYTDDGSPLVDYGRYASLVNLFGSPTFLPTSKLRRAPSRPTAISRTRTLAKDQKESLRREMCELLDTEERYVGKLYDLVNSVAVEFVRNARNTPYASTSPSERAMQNLFPESLTNILNISTAFMQVIRAILEESENDAINDIQNTAGVERPSNIKMRIRPRDLTGTEIFAKALLEWFPRFKEPYQDYLRASVGFPRILNDFLRDSASHFSHKIHATGEQRLRSWLIEPVQRLPRYSLFIDNMVNLLPATHPAMSRFLKARDIITDICALDNDRVDDSALTTSRLRDLVAAWPPSLSPHGRLITAVDAAELKPPYNVSVSAKEGQASMLLLFPDSLVVVRRPIANSLSARGLLAEIDRPALSIPATDSNVSPTVTMPKGLTFAFAFGLCDTQFTESHNGRLISMACVQCSANIDTSRTVSSRRCHAITKVYSLLGSYEGKAARWNEEVARARIEERFPEKLRETDKWTLRSTSLSTDNLGILVAIFESDCIDASGLKVAVGRARTRVVVDEHTDDSKCCNRTRGKDATIHVTMLDSDRFQVEFEGVGGFNSSDNVTSQEFAAVFIKKLSNLLRVHNQPHDLESAQAHISFHQKVVETLPIRKKAEESQGRQFRPISPIKVISSFLTGSVKQPEPVVENTNDRLTKDMPVMLPPDRSLSRPLSHHNPFDQSLHSDVTLVGTDNAGSSGSISHLERTFEAYMIALKSRSGNVVGRVLRGRASADELIVNELYNTLVEDPSKVQAAAEVSVDVLFAAFEKFLNKAWTQRLGPILVPQMLKKMQSVLDSSRTRQDMERLNTLLGEMTPQNRRGFASMIKLLSDLLDASGNDGDRGALIATFAEALVLEGNPHDYVTLLDRLVEDYDTFFDAPSEESSPNAASESLKRLRSINTGSLSSNASSLRKRFGFGTLTRENSRTDNESRAGSVWRTLSKNTKSPGDVESQPSSLSKSFLMRSRSTDNDNRRPLIARPVSQDRPTSSSGLSPEQLQHRPGSGHNTLTSLTTIGEGLPEHFQTPRKKRRSSLSDLKSLSTPTPAYVSSPAELRTVNLPESSIQKARLALRTPSPTKLQKSSRSGEDSPPRLVFTPKKENSPSIPRNTLTERAVNRKSDEISITSLSPQKSKAVQTGIPTLKYGLQERGSPRPRTISNNNASPKKAGSSPQKLRLQSPQKLRERLQSEQKAIEGAQGSLQAELTKISEEISALNLHRPPKTSSPDINRLATRMATLETKLTTTFADLSKRTTSIRSDLDSSLTVSEKKCKSLDQLYRDANAENEALYERFNDELEKVLKAVKGGQGQGVEEMKGKMKEAQDEAARLKKENQRLKREVVGLRSQLREG